MTNESKTDKKSDGMISREELEEHMERYRDIPDVKMYLDGKEVFPDDRHYDAYSSATGCRILQYGNGKPAGHTDSENLRYKIVE